MENGAVIEFTAIVQSRKIMVMFMTWLLVKYNFSISGQGPVGHIMMLIMTKEDVKKVIFCYLGLTSTP